MLRVNALALYENQRKELVIVDTTLTMSDSKALKQTADNLGKPVAGIILTHGHPDHVAGTVLILCSQGRHSGLRFGFSMKEIGGRH